MIALHLYLSDFPLEDAGSQADSDDYLDFGDDSIDLNVRRRYFPKPRNEVNMPDHQYTEPTVNEPLVDVNQNEITGIIRSVHCLLHIVSHVSPFITL